ncbi:MAG: DUF1307 domain-containing protein [Bacilli bacterium]|nr:DUF1307 domain-containing protein [Bacilli bacterium]
MKKFLCLFLILFISGCGNKSGVMECTRTTNQSNLSMDLKYTVSYEGKYVTKVSSVEKVTTEDEFVLDAYKKQLETILSSYKDIKYYDTDIKTDKNTITSTINIDYKKIDTDALIDIDSANATLIKDGKVRVSDLESMYNSLGITCSK